MTVAGNTAVLDAQEALQGFGPLSLILAIALLVLICAAIVLTVTLIRFVLLRIRNQDREKAVGTNRALSVSMVTGAPNHHSASPVPPENPHSPPTPPLGNQRVRR